MTARHDIEITPAVVSRIRARWPSAVRSTIRAEGKCPNCKSRTQVSFQTPDDWDYVDKPGWESCGYWCANCNWSNAGSRLIDPESEDS